MTYDFFFTLWSYVTCKLNTEKRYSKDKDSLQSCYKTKFGLEWLDLVAAHGVPFLRNQH